MGLILLTPPVAEPLTLAEAKAHVRQDFEADNDLLTGLIRAARLAAERETGRALVASTWRYTLDYFPCWEITLPRPPLVSVSSVKYLAVADGVETTVSADDYSVIKTSEPGYIEPSYSAVIWPIARDQSDAVRVEFVAGYPVTTVAAAITAGVATVTPASMAAIVAGSVLTIGAWNAQESVTVASVTSTTFTATFALDHPAYSSINCVPEDIRAAMKLLIGHWYTNREESALGSLTEIPMAAKALLKSNWDGSYLGAA